MDADDFQNLYKMLRGSRSALAVLDARAFYSDHKMVEAHEKLSYARDLFLESRSRLLKQDVEDQVDPKAKDADKQIKKLKRKQEKLLKTVEVFEELLPTLEKLASRERQRLAQEASTAAETDEAAASESVESETDPAIARPTAVSPEFVDAFANAVGDERLDLINDRFGFREVQSESDIHADALYFIHTGDQSLLVRTPAIEESAAILAVVNAVDDRPVKPFSREAFLKLGARRKMVLLTTRQAEGGESDPESGGDQPSDREQASDQSVLDMGAFSQLLSAAQRSGLVSGADQIGHVRDREFRMGKYDRAFQMIEAIYGRFMASSSHRAQQLSREDAEIGAGRIKISPKDLLAKRARDRQQTREIDRANRRFQVVLEGLRILMNRE
jgi:hypothetical protein